MPQLFTGLIFSLSLVLVAMGLTVIFGILGVINFAHGELYMLGGLIAFLILQSIPNFWTALLIAPILVAALGALIERGALHRIYGRHPLYTLILTFGLGLFFRQIGNMLLRGSIARIDAPFVGTVTVFGAEFPIYRIFIIIFVSIVFLALWLFFYKTRFGTIIRASTQDREMVECLGINVSNIYTFTFAFGAFLAGMAGLLMSPITFLYAEMGIDLLLWAFLVVIAGGMGSILGSIIAGFVLGELWSILSLFFDPRISEIILFAFVIIILFIRPRGFFGKVGVFD